MNLHFYLLRLLFFLFYVSINSLQVFGQNDKNDSLFKEGYDIVSYPNSIIKEQKNINSKKVANEDSIIKLGNDSISVQNVRPIPSENDSNIFFMNKFLQFSGAQYLMINSQRNSLSKELLFYIICLFLILFGMFKVFYSKYFFNVFKVFFNTSLRQNQLTDILLQARLASMLLNILFVISAGVYLWQIFIYNKIFKAEELIGLPICILIISMIYLMKFLVIKFIGWLTGFNTAADQFIFIIFLINKMIGVFLIPFIILLSFGPGEWNSSVVLVSWLLMGTLFILRYFRTYKLLHMQLSFNNFHFILYVVGIEVFPLIALYQLFGRFNHIVQYVLPYS